MEAAQGPTPLLPLPPGSPTCSFNMGGGWIMSWQNPATRVLSGGGWGVPGLTFQMQGQRFGKDKGKSEKIKCGEK